MTLEDQIRRYATDVVGPPVGDPPLDIPGASPGRGRWILAAALVLFIASVGFLALRPSGRATAPPATTEPLTEPTSWGGAFGSCAPGLPGVAVQGADGQGLCVGVEHSPDGAGIALVVNGTTAANWTYDTCAAADAASTIETIGEVSGSNADGRAASFWQVPSDVARFVVHLADGTQVVAETFTLPGVDGVSYAAAWLPPGDAQQGPLDLYSADGTPYTLTSGDGRIQPGCPGSELQQ